MRAKDLIPIPRLEDAKRILCIQPHPDDNDIAAGGTIARLAAQGAEIIYVTVTDGRVGTMDPQQDQGELAARRRSEQEEAAKTLGVSRLIWLDYADFYGLPAPDLRERLVETIRRYKPDGVLAPDPWLAYEAHPDHRFTGMTAAEASLFAEFPHVYPEQGKDGLQPHKVQFVGFYGTSRPNTFIDVSGTLDRKFAAIACHHSQFDEQTLALYQGYLGLRAQEWGERAGLPAAEAFKVLTTLHLHFNVDAEEC